MFFLYLAIFITIVSTPFLITGGWWIFTEDEFEALMLLGAGIVSFMIYRLKDYQVFENIRDRVRLQRSFARAQKELSESYSYIGQANRRTDIMYEIFSDLSHLESHGYKDGVQRAMALLPYTNDYSFRFINIEQSRSYKKMGGGSTYNHLPDTLFCENANTGTYRKKDMIFVYSESKEKNIRTCIALPYSEKAQNDVEFFRAITAYFTIVYAFHNHSCTTASINV